MEEGFNGLGRPLRAQIFSVAAESWLRSKTPHLSPRTVAIEEANLKHLKPAFGRTLLCDISAEDVAHYQQARLKEEAAPKTINLELGTFRAILRKNRLWGNLQPDVKMLRAREDTGRAISKEEETALLDACLASRSRSLYPAVVLALSTCMRYSEIRLLKWRQVDFSDKTVRVGDSKTDAGAGRVIPLNDRAYKVLTMWGANFPARKPEHFAFPTERYGAAGDDFEPHAYRTDPDAGGGSSPLRRCRTYGLERHGHGEDG
jgi:integrase